MKLSLEQRVDKQLQFLKIQHHEVKDKNLDEKGKDFWSCR